MLKMNKNLVAVAVVATIFAGCKTAQKGDSGGGNDSFAAIVERYNLTSEDMEAAFDGEDYAKRTIASIGGAIAELAKAAKGLPKVAVAGGQKITHEANLIRFANGLDGEIKALDNLKEAKFKRTGKRQPLTMKELQEGLSEADQLRLVKKYMDKENLANHKATVALYKDVSDRVSKLGSKEIGSGTAESKLLNDMNTSKFHANGTTSSKVKSTKELYDEALPKVQAIVKRVAAESPETAQNEKAIVDELMNAYANTAAMRQLTAATDGGPLKGFNANACETVASSLETAKRYNECLEDVRKTLDNEKEYPRDAKGRLVCKNTAEIAEWGAVTFQKKLVESGLVARNRVVEMCEGCNFLDVRIGKVAQRKLASNEPFEAPKCKK